MEVIVLKQFEKDLKKLKCESLDREVFELIERLEAVATIREASSVKKMKGFAASYRIRVGDYRVGCYVENNTVD